MFFVINCEDDGLPSEFRQIFGKLTYSKSTNGVQRREIEGDYEYFLPVFISACHCFSLCSMLI